MGHVINQKTLSPEALLKLAPPVILCSGWQAYEGAIKDAGGQTVSLNLPLAKTLAGKTEQEIASALTAMVVGLLPKGAIVYLTDFEMLFDPRYSIDVMRLFCEISRYSKLIVKWCGNYDGECLTYAEPGYSDYARYKVGDYEIACVTQEG